MGVRLYSEEEYREAAKIWKENNPDILMIPQSAFITISNGKEVPIGNRMAIMRSKLKDNLDYLNDEEKEFWSNYGLFKEAKKLEVYTEDEYREAARIWKINNINLDKIPTSAVVLISSGRSIPVGNRMDTMRRKIFKDQDSLDDEVIEFWMEYGLFKEERSYDLFTEEEYREAARIWRMDNPEKNMIQSRSVITISSGKEVPLGNRFSTMRKKLKNNPDYLDEDGKKFWSNYGVFHNPNIKYTGSNKHSETIDRYTGRFGNKEKALKAVNMMRKIKDRRNAKKRDYKVDSVLEEFDINIDTLNSFLGKNLGVKKTNSNTLMYKGISLKQYCLENGYNYGVIYRAIKLHKVCSSDDLESLINRILVNYNNFGQNQPGTWIYEKYGVLISHILTRIGIDSKSIFINMTNNCLSLEEAIRHEIFRKNRKEKKNNWLEELYEYIIDELNANKDEEQIKTDILDMFLILKEEFLLDEGELKILSKSFYDYVDVIKKYQFYDVGLETDLNTKLKKIELYNLDADLIEESFFVPLEFDEKVLIGRSSELYKRRQLLRQYCIDWNYFTKSEKIAAVKKHKLTEEELYYIYKTRFEIDTVIKERLKK